MALRHEVSDGTAVLTLDRPEVLNAFNDELGHAVLEAVNKASEDDSVRCIVITGEGRAFSSGEDLGALAEGYQKGESAPLGNVLVDRYNPLIRAITSAPKPVVAAINGVAAGAGASLALACDFRIASEKAKLVLAFIKVGLVPDSGGIWFLTKMVGAAKAWELCALGDPVSAEDALRLNLVHRVVPVADFDEAWRSFAAGLAAGPTRAYALTKRLLRSATVSSLEHQLDLEGELQAEAGRSQDHLEGVQAFLGKRAPRFEGK
ncbi:MAG: enoyl-CoA hydratase-related protein [Actinomycetota bacterium]